ncbi:hypothetical protein K438DRAFT_504579 [Mycena galopus ATCC 62051]|nr:hypothetical protein K438DRAFT_504579 [Mycena galopus ATCC 62051]
MTPPLSPHAAGVIAQRERGGAPGDGPAMAAIDPELMALSVSPSQTSERPKPKAAFRGTGLQSHTEPTASAFKLSPWFDALRPTSAPPTPFMLGTSSAGSKLPLPFTSKHLKPVWQVSGAAKPAGAQTTAARTLSDIIGANKLLTPAPVATHSSLPNVAARPPVAAAPPMSAPWPPPVVPTRPSPPIAATPPISPPPPVTQSPPIAAALAVSALAPPPVAPARRSHLVPAALPIAAPITAAPVLTTADLADLELPESRPAVKAPLDETARKGRKPPPKRKSGPRKVDDKEVAASQAKAVASVTAGAKRRGRPPKAAAAAASEGEGHAPLDDVTNSTTADTGTIVLCTVVGNNRALARRAAQQQKANDAKATEDAHKAQVAKGWLPGPEGSVVLLSSGVQKPTRIKKPTRNWEGVPFVVTKVNTRPRARPLDASEKALLARTAAAKTTPAKRKAPVAAKETNSRKKQKTT